MIQKVAILGLQSTSKLRDDLTKTLGLNSKFNVKSLFADFIESEPEGTYVDENGNLVTNDKDLTKISTLNTPTIDDIQIEIRDQIVNSQAKTMFCVLLSTIPKHGDKVDIAMVKEIVSLESTKSFKKLDIEKYLKIYDKSGYKKAIGAIHEDLAEMLKVKTDSKITEELQKYEITHSDDKITCIYDKTIELSVNTKNGEFYYQTLT